MNKNTLKVLEYEKIKENIKEFTVSSLGKMLVEKLQPSIDINIVRRMIDDTSEAKDILNSSNYIPLQGLHDINETLIKVEKGMVLRSEELIKVSDFLRGSRKMKKFMKSQVIIAPTLSSYSESITEINDIEDEINSTIEGNRVSDKASANLDKIRKKILSLEAKIEQKLNSILSSSKYKSYLQDFYVSKRNERYVIPVKSSYKNMISGNVIDTSSTGSTVFIEPSSINKLCNELTSLKIEEEREEYQILATLTGDINNYYREININVEAMAEYDFVFAKAKYSNKIGGVHVKINEEDYINLINARHPLLEDKPVPLNFEIGEGFRNIIITGPNTGGKTIVLKTVGLLTLMAQSGLHIPAESGSNICVFNKIFADIGDNQSIEQSLSTFSGHIKNIVNIINKSSISTLVLLDEIGTGTDPQEGAGLAAAILEEFYNLGAITLATTHYGEIKEFAAKHEGFQNACMEFDKNTLKPLYKLTIGKGGKSNALWISEKMGMKESVLINAKKYISKENIRNINVDESNFKKFDKSLNKKKKTKNSFVKNNENTVFEVGDSIKILNTDEYGIVYKLEDSYGDIVVLIKGEYRKINKKRVVLHIKGKDLYPEGYDLDIIFVPYKKRKFEKDIKRGSIKNNKKCKAIVNEINKMNKEKEDN